MCVLRPLIEGLQKRTFLMTFIREPAERALSEFYHLHASRHNETATDRHILNFVEKEHDHIMNYIATGESAAEIMAKYDFIGITDRFAESMLVLAHRLGIGLEDMLYVKAKDSHHLKVDNKGYHFVPSVPVNGQSEEVQEYIKGEWTLQNAADYELWTMANAEMDRWIANIDGFADDLKRYKDLLEKVEDKCGDLPNKKVDCIHADEGCGMHCIQKVLKIRKS